MHDFQQINTKCHTHRIWGSPLYYYYYYFRLSFFDRFVMSMNKQQASFSMRIFATTTISIVHRSFFSLLQFSLCNRLLYWYWFVSLCAIVSAFVCVMQCVLLFCSFFYHSGGLLIQFSVRVFATIESNHAYFVSILLLCFNFNCNVIDTMWYFIFTSVNGIFV